MVYRVLVLLLVVSYFFGCSSEEEVPLVSEFPKLFTFDSLATTGMRTYYFTDSIIYRVDNLQDLDTMSMMLDELSAQRVGRQGPNGDEFFIKSIEFTSLTDVTVSYYNGGALTSANSSYILENNIGAFDTPFLFNFKVNEDLSRLLSCYSNIATRRIDTLFIDTDMLLPELDTFDVDGMQFQLIPTDEPFISGLCNPTNESIEMELYAQEKGLQNNDRIIIHRLDLLFSPSNN